MLLLISVFITFILLFLSIGIGLNIIYSRYINLKNEEPDFFDISIKYNFSLMPFIEFEELDDTEEVKSLIKMKNIIVVFFWLILILSIVFFLRDPNIYKSSSFHMVPAFR